MKKQTRYDAKRMLRLNVRYQNAMRYKRYDEAARLAQVITALRADGGPRSGNHEHEGRPGSVGGSAPTSEGLNSRIKDSYGKGYLEAEKGVRAAIHDMPVGSTVTSKGTVYTKTGDDEYEYDFNGKTFHANENQVVNGSDMFHAENAPTIWVASSEETAEQMVENGELDPKETSVSIPEERAQDEPKDNNKKEGNMTKTELKKVAKSEGYDFDYLMDVKEDMESDGIKVRWEDLADMIYNGDI